MLNPGDWPKDIQEDCGCVLWALTISPVILAVTGAHMAGCC